MARKGPHRRRLSEANLAPSNVIEYAEFYNKPIQVLSREAAVLSRNGTNLIGIYKELQPAHVADCGHMYQICNACAASWFNDCYVSSFRHASTSGYGKGCRCNPCKHASAEANSRNKKVESES